MRWRRRLLRRQRKNGTTPRDTQRNAEEKALREEREAHARRATERARQLAGRPPARGRAALATLVALASLGALSQPLGRR